MIAMFRTRRGVLPACLLAMLGACSAPDDKGKEAATTAAVPVEAVAAAPRAIRASYTGTATLEADSEALVAAKTSGALMQLMVEEGDTVRAGQVLARIDDESARLNLAKAEATLRKLENDHRRSSEMFARKLLSVEQNDKIRYDLETQRASWELARLELSYTRVVAPIGGVISRRLVKVGAFIKLNDALFRIDNFDPLLAVLNVPERELATLGVGQEVAMRVDSLATERFGGRIARISPVVDPATGTFRVTCEFRDRDGRLKSGMFGRLEVATAQREHALAIPRAALVEEDGETAVYAIVAAPAKDADAAKAGDDKKAAGAVQPVAEAGDGKPASTTDANTTAPSWVVQRRLVKLGYGDAGYVEILEGLAEGDRVVTVGRAAVRDGTPVQVLEGVP